MKRGILILGGIALGSMVQAVEIYNLTNPTPAVAFANSDPGVIMFDDILIPTYRLLGEPRISIKRFVVSIDVATPGTYSIEAWVAKGKIAGGQLQPDSATRVGTITFTLNNVSLNQPVTFGNGVNEVFSLPVLPFTFNTLPYGMFFFGLKFNSPLQNIGWNLADGPDANLDGFYNYYGAGNSQNGATTLGGFRASFNVKMSGDPVPEPSPWVGLAVGCLGLFGFRKRFRVS